MPKRCRRVEQLELYHLQRKIPDWKTLPARVREEVIEDLTRMFRDRCEPQVAHEKQGGSRLSEKIKAEHSTRKAVLHIRQSLTFQVTHNKQSRRLQYAMRPRIRNLRWQEVSVIDEGLG